MGGNWEPPKRQNIRPQGSSRCSRAWAARRCWRRRNEFRCVCGTVFAGCEKGKTNGKQPFWGRQHFMGASIERGWPNMGTCAINFWCRWRKGMFSKKSGVGNVSSGSQQGMTPMNHLQWFPSRESQSVHFPHSGSFPT